MHFENYFDSVKESSEFLRRRISRLPQLILVLSGGLDSFVNHLKVAEKFHASQIPHFSKIKVEGHSGEIIFGTCEGFPMVVLRGRTHFYEGLSPQEVVFPYFVLHSLGAQFLITTNAVGGIREDLEREDIVVVEDHINMMGSNPLIGLSVQRPNDQFPSMQKAYDGELIHLAQKVAKGQNLKLKTGVYLGNSGPSYETPAEIRACRKLGADTVGMSTIFEVIAARFLKMRVLAFNIITNPAADRHAGQMKHGEVLEAMQKVQTKVVGLLQGVVGAIAKL